MSHPPSPDARIATAPASGQTARNARPRPGLTGSAVRPWMQPSDPRPGIVPRGCAGWPVRGVHFAQSDQADQILDFVTSPNNASELSTLWTYTG
jgi:hypothetical protein